jgi:hypothetical protein
MKVFSKDHEKNKNQKNIRTRRTIMFLALVVAACTPAQTDTVDVEGTLAALIQTGVALTQTALSEITPPSSTPMATIIEPTSSTLPTSTLAPAEPQFFVLLSGMVGGESEAVTLDTVYVLDHGPATQVSSGPYSIRFEDANGVEIESHSFEVLTGFDGSPGIGVFTLLLPWNIETTRIVLLKDNVELVSRSASKNAPVVTVTSPNGGENLTGPTVTVAWSAVDADNDSLAYIVQYTTDDGINWNTVAIDFTETELELDLSLVSNTDIGRVRVLASDGFLTSQDESDNVFTIATEKPVYVDIFNDDGATFSGGQTVILDGEAYTNSGSLPEDSLVWSSDLDGELAIGEQLSINARELSEGTHRITLTAHDGEMQSGSDTITIHIYRDFSSLSVDVESLNFTAKPGDVKVAEQVVEIWHLGSHSIKWSAAADQKWIQLIAVQGQGTPAESETPSDLAVFVDPKGLSAGTYTGTITITSNAEGVNTHTITVTLEVKK